MKKLTTLLLLVIMILTVASCGESASDTEVTEPSSIFEFMLNEDESLSVTFKGEAYALLLEKKEELDMSNSYSLSIGARIYDVEDIDLGVVYYDIYVDHEDASYTVDYQDFFFAVFGEGITFETTEESVTVTVLPDNIDGLYETARYAEITISDQEFKTLYSETVKF